MLVSELIEEEGGSTEDALAALMHDAAEAYLGDLPHPIKHRSQPTGVWATRERMRHAEKQLAAQAEASYKRSVADWHAASPKKEKAGASVTAGRA